MRTRLSLFRRHTDRPDIADTSMSESSPSKVVSTQPVPVRDTISQIVADDPQIRLGLSLHTAFSPVTDSDLPDDIRTLVARLQSIA